MIFIVIFLFVLNVLFINFICDIFVFIKVFKLFFILFKLKYFRFGIVDDK